MNDIYDLSHVVILYHNLSNAWFELSQKNAFVSGIQSLSFVDLGSVIVHLFSWDIYQSFMDIFILLSEFFDFFFQFIDLHFHQGSFSIGKIIHSRSIVVLVILVVVKEQFGGFVGRLLSLTSENRIIKMVGLFLNVI